MNQPLCGFLSVIYYHDIKDSDGFIKFTSDYQRNDIIQRTWGNHRRQRSRDLLLKVRYKNEGRGGERDTFISYFKIDNFTQLSENDQKLHQMVDCEECLKNHRAMLHLRVANARVLAPANEVRILQEILENTPADGKLAIPQCRQVVNSVQNVLKQSDAPGLETFLPKRKQSDVSNVTKPAKRRILMEARDHQQKSQTSKDFLALYATNQSESEWQKQRKLAYGQYKENPAKSHCGSLESYHYDQDKLIQIINDADNINKINFAQVARDIGLKRDGKLPGNSTQVTKQIVRSMGIEVTEKKTKRISWQNYNGYKLNIHKPTSATDLRAKKHEMIENGDIDIGELVVPVSYTTVTNRKEDGMPITRVHTVSGRKFNLRNIRIDHWERMKKFGVVRSLKTDNMTDSQVSETLEKHGETVMGDSAYDRERLDKLSRTRNMVMWHDHSNILGKSHYLFMVWFLYDDLIYLTDEEFKDNDQGLRRGTIQSIVEKPYPYLLAQSGTSVKDQLLYTTTRMEDINDLETPITVDDNTIYDQLRFFTGDTPARSLESGQQCGGGFPCFCGARDTSFCNPCLYNQPGSFRSPAERNDLLNKTGTWSSNAREGNLAPFSRLKVDEVRRELDARGIEYEPEDKAPELKEKLVTSMKGVRRPLALLCPNAESCPYLANYEICQVEPLHDLKNVISRLFEELPSCAEDLLLKSVIKEKLDAMNVENRVKGTDRRLDLINLTTLLAPYATTGEGKHIHSMLLALVELQHMAYAPESSRTPRLILRAYNKSFVFAIHYLHIFAAPTKNTVRSVYGMPFHTMSVHLAESLRLVSGQSIVAENSERHFNTLRQTSVRTSNRKCEDIITNALFRLTINRQAHDGSPTAYELQQERISSHTTAEKGLGVGYNTIIPNSFFDEHLTASLTHLSRIADYIEPGEGVWYQQHPTALEFFDGDTQQEYHPQGPTKTHFRSSTMKDVLQKVERSWKDCLRLKDHIHIPLLSKLTADQETAIDKDKQCFQQRPSLSAAIENTDMMFTDPQPSTSMVSTSPLSNPVIDKRNDDQAIPLGKDTSERSTSLSQEDSEPFISSIPLLQEEGDVGLLDHIVTEESVKAKRGSTPRQRKLRVEDIVRDMFSRDEKKVYDSFLRARTRKDESRTVIARVSLQMAATKLRPIVERHITKVKVEEKKCSMDKFRHAKSLTMPLAGSAHCTKLQALGQLFKLIERFSK